MNPAMTSTDATIDWRCFTYLVVEKAELYRPIIAIFAAAKAEFSLHLRSSEVRTQLALQDVASEPGDVEAALQQLESWGNLQSYQDNADVASLTEYYRTRLLYQLSARGEAAHASTLTFAERLRQQAKLDARALDRITDGAGQLNRLATDLRKGSPVDSKVALAALRNICHDADELTSRAQAFFRWLHEQTESDRGDLTAFLAYKQQLIEYLQQFVSELIQRTDEIAGHLRSLDEHELQRLAEIAAGEEAGEPRVGEEAAHQQHVQHSAARWQSRLAGLCGWFMSRGGRPPQADQLRGAARAAIPRLLQLASQMNERQSGRSDRVADLRTLAGHFLRCADDRQAQRLFRAAFGLSPARHLRVDQATLEARDQNPLRRDTRWVDAEPVQLTPQLRATGREPAAAPNRGVVDRSRQRAEASRRLGQESGRDDAARETLIALGRSRLSAIGTLDRHAFGILLGLLELAVPKGNATSATALSRDGRLKMTWQGVDTGQEGTVPIARLETAGGYLRLPDAWVEVTRAGR